MPRKKPTPLTSEYVKLFAKKRQLPMLTKEDGHLLMDLLSRAGIKMSTRGNSACQVVTVEDGMFVIVLVADTPKP